MKHNLLSITVLLLLLTNITIVATAQNTPSVVKKSLDSIVAIEVENTSEKTISKGIGFFVTPNQVVTHLSILKDWTPTSNDVEIYVMLVGKKTKHKVQEVVRNNSSNLALLNVPIPNIKPLSISNKVKHAGSVYSISDPSKPKLVKGIVKGNSKYKDYIRVSNPISEKNLGSPLLNSKGEVIGVSILLSELNRKFIYDDGKISISFENKGSIVSLNSTEVSGITITESKIKIGDSAFAVSSNVLNNLLEKPNSVLVNSPRMKDNTDQRKSDLNRIEKAFDVNAYGRLTIDTEFGDIDVQTDALDIAKVIVTKESKNELGVLQKALDDFMVTFNKKGADLTIKGEFGRGRNYWQRTLNAVNIHFQVTVPQQYDIDLNTPSGDISVDGVSGKLQARSSAGDVSVKNATGTINVQTSAGDLQLNTVKGPIIGKSSAGDIRLTNCQGRVNIQTSAGDIRANMPTQLIHEWSLQTSAGDIVFTLPRNLAAEVDAQTSAGDISIDYQVRGSLINRKRVHGNINGGGNLLKLRTTAGDIRLKNR